jgi:hypothetical protein
MWGVGLPQDELVGGVSCRVGELVWERGGATGTSWGSAGVSLVRSRCALVLATAGEWVVALAGSVLPGCDKGHVVRVHDVPRKGRVSPMFT